MDTLSEANGTFAISLLKMLCQDNPLRNVSCSPLSVSSALAVVLLGAKGDTAVQMAQALSLNPEKGAHQGFQSLLTELNKRGAQYQLQMANRLFGENTCKFLQTFKDSCLRFYHADLEPLAFAKAAQECRQHINTWVSKQTEGKIQELLPSNSITANTKLVLVNTIYFKGRWDEQFDKTCTSEMPFKVNQARTLTTKPSPQPGYCSCCCEQTPDKKQLKGGRTHFDLQFEGIQSILVVKAGGRHMKQLVTLHPQSGSREL